ncbi:MAG: L,D-transpeptidase family protein [Alphaproteobacteria bacterium]|nr:L,D-transpeptidase family protein [Alphaproteobacteria bacterium]
MNYWSARTTSLAIAVSCLAIVTAVGHAHASKKRDGSGSGVALSLPETKSEAPVLMLVSLDKQNIRVFSGDTLVAQSNVSTGKKGHATPTGVFSILQKKRRHHSNIYSRAPMPFMQRLTWSGIALHESNSVPSHPASHGCVRLPRAFAKQLYRYTDLGAHVIISDEEINLRALPTRALFDPIDEPASTTARTRNTASVHFVSADPSSRSTLSPSIDAAGASTSMPAKPLGAAIGTDYVLRTSLDDSTKPSGDSGESLSVSDDPVRILITRRTGRELVRDIQTMLNALGFDAGETDGWMGPATGRAIVGFQKEHALTPTGTVSVELASMLREKTGGSRSSNGHIYVRQSGKPIFDAPIELTTPEKPLGTHFLSALPSATDPDAVVWAGATLNDTAALSPLSEITESSLIDRPTPSIRNALARIKMPDLMRERLEPLLIAGSSVVISDHGLSRETLRGTDFVVLTNPKDAD